MHASSENRGLASEGEKVRKEIIRLTKQVSKDLKMPYEVVLYEICIGKAEEIFTKSFSLNKLLHYYKVFRNGIDEILDNYFKENNMNAIAGLRSVYSQPVKSLEVFRIQNLLAATAIVCKDQLEEIKNG